MIGETLARHVLDGKLRDTLTGETLRAILVDAQALLASLTPEQLDALAAKVRSYLGV